MLAMTLTAPASIDTAPMAAQEIGDPEPGPDEIRVKVSLCAICRTDLHVCEGELPPVTAHIVPGHQVVGTVEKRGEKANRFNIGDRVGIAWLRWTCGQCKYCRNASENLCPNAKFTGYTDNGGYAQLATVRQDYAYAIPTQLDDLSAAPLLCAGIIGFRALQRADVKPGCVLGLYGFGSSAHIAIQVAKHWKCTVYVCTRDQRHQALARQLGADWAGESNQPPPKKLDSAILFAPVGDLVPPALEALDRGGTLAIAGIYLSDIPKLNYDKTLFQEKNLRSVTANTRKDGEELLKVAAEIPLRPQTTVFPLRQANDALRQLKHDGITGSGVLAIG